MSAFEDLFEEVAAPALLEHGGEPVGHWPAGADGVQAEVTGIFDESHEPRRELGRGEEQVRRATLLVAASVVTNVKDRWAVRGEEWATVGAPVPKGGLKTIQLQRNEKTATRQSGGLL